MRREYIIYEEKNEKTFLDKSHNPLFVLYYIIYNIWV